jgi:hypothetical protein
MRRSWQQSRREAASRSGFKGALGAGALMVRMVSQPMEAQRASL